MFTGFFTDRAQAGSLRRVLRAQALRAFQFDSNCEVGPFIVDFLCRERSLIVELQRPASAGNDPRTAFLTAMGYVVVQVSRRELRSSPAGVVRRLRMALEGRSRRRKPGGRGSI